LRGSFLVVDAVLPSDATAAPFCEKQPSVPTPYAMFLTGLKASG
jgi:hypothetical protein